VNKANIIISLFLLMATLLHAQPEAKFKLISSSGCAPFLVQAINQSVAPDSTKYFWDFGKTGNFIPNDKDTVTDLYTESGEYTLSLIAVLGNQRDTFQSVIRVFKLPVADFSANNKACIPLNAKFKDLSIPGDAPIKKWFWDFKDNTSSSLQNPEKNYTADGKFDVFLNITDTNNCSSYIVKEAYMEVYKQALMFYTADVNYACKPPLTVKFTNQTVSALPLDYTFYYGTGDSVKGNFNNYTYTDTGSYQTKLIGRNEWGCYGEKITNNHVVINSATADFTINGRPYNTADTVCAGLIEFKSKSKGSSLNKWILSGVGTFFTDNINGLKLKYDIQGTYTVTLIAGVGTSCPDTLTKSFYIQKFSVSFDIPQLEFCSYPINIKPENISAKGATLYAWALTREGDMLPFEISTAANPEFIIKSDEKPDSFSTNTEKSVKNYIISLVATNKNFCEAMLTMPVMYNPIIADFGTDKSFGCAPLKVNFENFTNYGKFEKFKWIFGDGATDSAKAVSAELIHEYVNPGIYNARLLAYSKLGCVDTSLSMQIKVGDKLNGDFTASKANVCTGDSITFSYIGSDQGKIQSIQFQNDNLGLEGSCDGTNVFTYAVNPNFAGLFDVTMRLNYNGCFSYITKEDLIYVRGPYIDFKPIVDCGNPFRVKFQKRDTLVSNYLWDYGDGTTSVTKDTAVHQYANPGTYTVKVSVSNDTTSCPKEKLGIVHIKEVKANFSVKENVCKGLPVILDASASKDVSDECLKAGYLWTFDNKQNPRLSFNDSLTIAFMEKGSYKIKLEVFGLNGCSDSLVKNIQVHQPEVLFNTDKLSGCAPATEVQFSNTSTDTTIVRFVWDFKDGNLDSTNKIVKHTYNSNFPVSYFPTLTVFDTYACSNSINSQFKILKPIADFTSVKQNFCAGEIVDFTLYDPSVSSFKWYFGDGISSTSSMQHVYSQRGNYPVSLVVTQDLCRDSITKNNFIRIQSTNSKFSVSDTVLDCYPATIIFTNVGAIDSIASGRWFFGDGNSTFSYFDKASYTYTRPGSFTASLVTQSTFGCKDTSELLMLVRGPQAKFKIEPLNVCKAEPVNFSITESEYVAKFEWFFGDGTSSKDTSPVHYYNIFGAINPTLYIEDDKGCNPPSVKGETLNIYEVISGFSIADTLLCINEPLEITNEAKGADNISYLFGDGELQNIFQPDPKLFASSGIYKITQLISNSIGCKDTTNKMIEIKALPDLQLTFEDSICRDQTVQFSSSSGHKIVAYQWTPNRWLDDASISAPLSKPDSSVVYSLKVTDDFNCSNTKDASIFVQQYPRQLNPLVAEIVIGESLTFNAYSNNPSIYSWSPEKFLNCYNCPVVTAIPEDSIMYTVTIKDNCFTWSNTYTVNIIKEYSVHVPAAFTPNGDGVNDYLFIKGWGIKELIEFSIFNRWGNKVYTASNLYDGWDGTFNGKKQAIDTYVYVVRVLGYDGKERTTKGTVNIIK